MSTDPNNPERTVTADFDEVDRIMRDAVTNVRTGLTSGIDYADERDRRAAEYLADLLEELADEMSGDKATEVRIHSYAPDRQVHIVEDLGFGRINDIWTRALKLARVIVGGPDDPQAHARANPTPGER